MRPIPTLAIGILFGIVLVKSEVASWFRIQKMFRFEEAHMYLIIGSAVLVGIVSVWLLKRLKLRSLAGEELRFVGKRFQTGTVVGGALFGLGWAITGACPGPIYAQLGNGEYLAAITLVGALIGAYLYALLRPKLPH